MRTTAWLLVTALSLSIGWGIRGNYGHELGAMFPGALAGIAVALGAGRPLWRERVPWIALLGALGWGIGGSMSYSQLIAYVHSGDEASRAYGFGALWFVGFLWAALGTGATGLAATLDAPRLTALIRPLLVIAGIDAALWFAEDLIDRLGLPDDAARHEGSLYWFDADWFPVAAMLAGLLVYDLAARRFEGALRLAAAIGIGAAIGAIIAASLVAFGLDAPLASVLVRPQGDLTLHSPERLVLNWPLALVRLGPVAFGAIAGGIAGVAVHFSRERARTPGLGLLLSMLTGWFVGFLILPVLLGVRMTPPRGDNWAGVLGAFAGALVWMRQNGAWPVAAAAFIGGTIGGIGFAGAAWLELLARAPGSEVLETDPSIIARWAFWQQANWHSVLEQSYGFVNGIGLFIALRWLAKHLPATNLAPSDELPATALTPPRWTGAVAVAFVAIVMPFANLSQNIESWTGGEEGRPPVLRDGLRTPLLGIEASATTWWFAAWTLFVFTGILIIARHARRPLAAVPESALGRGQLLWLWVAGIFVLGDVARYLPVFHERRLITEGAVFANALFAAVLLLLVRPPELERDDLPATPHAPRAGALITAALLAGFVATAFFSATAGAVWGNESSRARGGQLRFGPDATWRMKPLLRGEEHS